MRKLAIVLGLIISLATVYAYATPKGRPSSRVQLLGFTEQTVAGGGFALPAACEDEFPGSRVCAPRDIMRTIDVPESVANLDPTYGNNWAWMDGTTLESEGASLVCDIPVFERRNGVLLGGAVGPDGRLGGFRCETPLRVACCGRPQARRDR